jgi:hypothetical protein
MLNKKPLEKAQAIQVCLDCEANVGDVVLAELVRRVRVCLEAPEHAYAGMEVDDVDASCLKVYYRLKGYCGQVQDVIDSVEFCNVP